MPTHNVQCYRVPFAHKYLETCIQQLHSETIYKRDDYRERSDRRDSSKMVDEPGESSLTMLLGWPPAGHAFPYTMASDWQHLMAPVIPPVYWIILSQKNVIQINEVKLSSNCDNKLW